MIKCRGGYKHPECGCMSTYGHCEKSEWKWGVVFTQLHEEWVESSRQQGLVVQHSCHRSAHHLQRVLHHCSRLQQSVCVCSQVCVLSVNTHHWFSK